MPQGPARLARRRPHAALQHPPLSVVGPPFFPFFCIFHPSLVEPFQAECLPRGADGSARLWAGAVHTAGPVEAMAARPPVATAAAFSGPPLLALRVAGGGAFLSPPRRAAVAHRTHVAASPAARARSHPLRPRFVFFSRQTARADPLLLLLLLFPTRARLPAPPAPPAPPPCALPLPPRRRRGSFPRGGHTRVEQPLPPNPSGARQTMWRNASGVCRPGGQPHPHFDGLQQQQKRQEKKKKRLIRLGRSRREGGERSGQGQGRGHPPAACA